MLVIRIMLIAIIEPSVHLGICMVSIVEVIAEMQHILQVGEKDYGNSQY